MREMIEIVDRVHRGLDHINFDSDEEEKKPLLTQGLIDTKKNNLRGTFLIEYPLEDLDHRVRIKALFELIGDLRRIANPRTDLRALENQKFLFSIFRGNSAEGLAKTNPAIALGTKEEVLDYYLEFIPDIIYKSVYGKYPEGRGAAIHGQTDDTEITTLQKWQLEKVYRELGKDKTKPLFDSNDLERLEGLFTPSWEDRMQAIKDKCRTKDYRVSFPAFAPILLGIMNFPAMARANRQHQDSPDTSLLMSRECHARDDLATIAMEAATTIAMAALIAQLGYYAVFTKKVVTESLAFSKKEPNPIQPKFVEFSSFNRALRHMKKAPSKETGTSAILAEEAQPTFLARVSRAFNDMCDERAIY